MHIDHQREKLIQTVIFLAHNVRKLGKIKLFKLLYFFDFMHFRETGRSVTGLDYFAWKMGPVPTSLYGELDAPEADWTGRVVFQEKLVRGKHMMLTVQALVGFDKSHFTKRELRLLETLCGDFYNSTAEDMVEETHLENSPWHKVWEVQGKHQAEIPYEYALRAQDADAVTYLSAERTKLLSVFASS